MHWDVMVQCGDVLWTWRAACVPTASAASLPLEKIADHPLRFLTYEGPVQNHTGQVRRIDAGACLLKKKSNSLCIDFQGQLLRGAFVLENIGASGWVLRR